MSDLPLSNRVYLRGFVESKPDIRYFDYGHVLAGFTLSTLEASPTRDDPERIIKMRHYITAWGERAEQVERELLLGQEIRLIGRLSYSKETDREGVTRIWPAVECLRLEVLAEAHHSSTESDDADEDLSPIDWSAYSPDEDEDPMA